MKFQLKALAAAAILAASIPAQAAIDSAASGNGSMILTVLDTVSQVSAAFDLGKNYSDFNMVASTGFAVSNVTNPGTSFSWNLAGNADYATTWANFLATSASDANIKYAITAGDLNAVVALGQTGYISSYVANGTALTTSGLTTAIGNFDTYTANLSTLLGSNTNTVANGSALQIPPTIFYGSNKNNGTGPVVMGAIGTNLGVVQVVSSASSFTNATQTIFGNGAFFNLSSTGALVYSVAAVPEADTWAMMMLGLGFMGFVARRKQA